MAKMTRSNHGRFLATTIFNRRFYELKLTIVDICGNAVNKRNDARKIARSV